MVIRVVLAVLLASALLGVSLPAFDHGRAAHAGTQVRADLVHLAGTAERLSANNDPVPPAAGSARRFVTVRVPRATWTSAEAHATIGNGTDALAWQAGPRRGTLRVETPLRVVRDGRALPDGPGLELGPGRHRLVLELVASGGRPVVLVRRFKAENGTSHPHVRAARGRS